MTQVKEGSGSGGNEPLVSIIMNCYNGEKYLREAIDSVYAQSYKNWEIIFWDNLSTDNSANIAKSYDGKLKYYKGETNVTLGAARNKAISKVTGEYIAFLDVDDLWLPTKLEKQIPLFTDDKIAIVYSDVEYFDETGNSFRLYKKGKYYEGFCFKELLGEYFLSIQSVVVRVSSYERKNIRFDESFSIIEEADFFCRIALKNKLKFYNEVLCKYRIHSESMASRNRQKAASELIQLIEGYKNEIEDFEKIYSKEIKLIRKKSSMINSKYYWDVGKKIKAIKHIAKYYYDPKIIVLIIAIVIFSRRQFNYLINILRLRYVNR